MAASILFAAVGLLAFATLLLAHDPLAIVQAVLSVGIGGFALLLAWQMLLYLPLGAAWRCLDRRLPLRATLWARAVREGAANCLPLSVVGGIVFGARALAASSPAEPSEAVATSIVDVTLEFVAQIGFAAVGVALLALHRPDVAMVRSTLLVLPVALGAAVAAVLCQTWLLGRLRALSARIGRPHLAGGADFAGLIDRAYGQPSRIALAVGLHLIAWFGSAVGSWLAFNLLDVPIDLTAAIAIEGVLCLARAASFVVPAGLGVQEAAYVGLGALYGIPAETALAVSLLRRARELALGAPALLAAQWPGRRADPAEAPSAPRGWVAGAVGVGDRLLDRMGYWSDAPTVEAALKAVADEPGRAALDRDDLREAMEQWVSSLREEANLNAIGRIGAHWDTVRLLRIQCRLAEEEARDPSILAAPVEAPLFITGMPRSGSTFLHGVLAQDGHNLVPRCWQAMEPYPPRTGRDRRAADARFQLDMFTRLSPGLASVHPLSPDTPQECSELMAPSFRSLRFDTTHHVPTYRAWLDRSGHRQAYAFLHRLLQHLQRQMGPGRWVLKCPDHVFALDALLESFPDARFVVMHRDPLKVLPSAARLTELLRRPFTRAVDRDGLGRHVVRDWLDGARRIVEIGDMVPADRLLHIHYRAISDRPMETVAALYERFGMALAGRAAERIEQACARPRGGYGRNRYRFADFGIEPAFERERFRFYTEAFGVDEEVRLADYRIHTAPAADDRAPGGTGPREQRV